MHPRTRLLTQLTQALFVDRFVGRLRLHDLVDAAVKRTALTDFGESDWQEPLAIMLHDYQHEARLHRLGQVVAWRLLTAQLANRLRVVDALRSKPVSKVDQPIFILGLPRTGSTLLHETLACHPLLRAPHFWECETLTQTSEQQRRHRNTTAGNVFLVNFLAPDFQHIHPIGADRPHECITLQAPTFRSMQNHAIHRLPNYSRWLLTCDLQPAYHWHAQYLGLLQNDARRWVLKAPAHLRGIEALAKQYPDAVFVQLHRQPQETLPSMASLYATLHSTSSRHVDKREIGQNIYTEWSTAINTTLQARQQDDLNNRFIDVHYGDLVQDPLKTCDRILQFASVPRHDGDHAEMQAFLDQPRHQHRKRHTYSLEEFGLDSQQVAEGFGQYLARHFST